MIFGGDGATVDTAIVRMGPIGVYSAGLALGVGLVVAGYVGARRAERRGYSPGSWWAAVLGVMTVALIGARIGYVLTNWSHFAHHSHELVRLPIDGLSYFAGLLAGISFVALHSRRRGESVWATLDLFALPYATGLLVTVLMWRTPVVIAGLSSWLVVAGELAYVSGLYAVLWSVWRRRRDYAFSGQLFLMAVIGDMVMRLVVGGALLPTVPWDASLAWSSVGMPLVVLVGAVLMYRVRGGPEAFRLRREEQPASKRPPFTRWIGWFTMYGFLLGFLVVSRIALH